MYVIIVGCGRVGALLATDFCAEGHAVVVIDKDPDSFTRLGDDFRGSTITGNGIDEDVLKNAGAERADAFITTTNGDNSNLMSAQIAQKIFGVEKVVARCSDPVRSEAYAASGLTTMCPTTVGASKIREALGAAGAANGDGK